MPADRQTDRQTETMKAILRTPPEVTKVFSDTVPVNTSYLLTYLTSEKRSIQTPSKFSDTKIMLAHVNRPKLAQGTARIVFPASHV